MTPETDDTENSNVNEIDFAELGRDRHDHAQLMDSMIQSDSVAMSILKPVFAENGIIDFVWVMANKLLRAHANAIEVIGRRYTDVFPDSRSNGVLETLKEVYTTGKRHEGEVYHEDHNIKAWLRHVYVKSHQYVILRAEDITVTKKKQSTDRCEFTIALVE